MSLSDKHVHLCLISLKDYAPDSMAKVVIQILELVGKNVDTAMLMLDQSKILMALDVLITLTDFVRSKSLLEYGDESRDFKKSGFPEAGLQTEE